MFKQFYPHTMFHKANIMKYIRLSRAQPNYTNNDNLANVAGIWTPKPESAPMNSPKVAKLHDVHQSAQLQIFLTFSFIPPHRHHLQNKPC